MSKTELIEEIFLNNQEVEDEKEIIDENNLNKFIWELPLTEL